MRLGPAGLEPPAEARIRKKNKKSKIRGGGTCAPRVPDDTWCTCLLLSSNLPYIVVGKGFWLIHGYTNFYSESLRRFVEQKKIR